MRSNFPDLCLSFGKIRRWPQWIARCVNTTLFPSLGGWTYIYIILYSYIHRCRVHQTGPTYLTCPCMSWQSSEHLLMVFRACVECVVWQRLTGLRCLPTDTVMTPKKEAGGCWLELLGRSVAVTQSHKVRQKHHKNALWIDPDFGAMATGCNGPSWTRTSHVAPRFRSSVLYDTFDYVFQLQIIAVEPISTSEPWLS